MLQNIQHFLCKTFNISMYSADRPQIQRGYGGQIPLACGQYLVQWTSVDIVSSSGLSDSGHVCMTMGIQTNSYSA